MVFETEGTQLRTRTTSSAVPWASMSKTTLYAGDIGKYSQSGGCSCKLLVVVIYCEQGYKMLTRYELRYVTAFRAKIKYIKQAARAVPIKRQGHHTFHTSGTTRRPGQLDSHPLLWKEGHHRKSCFTKVNDPKI